MLFKNNGRILLLLACCSSIILGLTECGTQGRPTFETGHAKVNITPVGDNFADDWLYERGAVKDSLTAPGTGEMLVEAAVEMLVTMK